MTEYTVALYIRLSSADGDKDGESNSVTNQRDLLKNYIATHEEFAKARVLYFADDGYTGTNFDRPAVKQMIDKAKKGEINCIIVKDFSRFGRNYIEVGDYLDRYFPFLGVRFISANDRYDSNDNIGNTPGLDVSFKTFIHSLYSKDISQKTRIGRKAKAEKGVHLCNLAPYGYVKSKTEKNKILIDEQVAPIIRQIFDMALSGMRNIDIVAKLNNEKIDSPLVYRKKCGSDKGHSWNAKCETNLWTNDIVSRVLRDERYTGKLVSGKRIQIVPLHKKTKLVPKEDWIVAENAHEGIISQESFDEVQKLMRRKIHTGTPLNKRLFANKLYCGYCGYALKHNPTLNPYYRCNADRSGYSTVKCFDERVYESDIKQALLSAVKAQLDFSLDVKSKIEQQSKSVKQTLDALSLQLKKLSERLNFLESHKSELFKDYADGKLSKDKYIESKEDCLREVEKVKQQITELESKSNITLSAQNTSDFLNTVKQLSNVTDVTTDILSLVDRIDVYDGNRIEIKFSFRDEFERIYSSIKK